MTHILVFNLVLLATCGYALFAGGAPERWTATVFVTGALATFAVPDFYPSGPYRQVEPILLAIDAVMLCALVVVALRADRYWPLYVSALHLITLAIHGVKAVDPSLVPWMYAGASGKIAYPMLLMLAFGALRHRQRIALFGSDRDWSPLRQPDTRSS